MRAQPYIVRSGKAEPLARLPRTHNEFSEAYLQGLLADYPHLLPVSVLRSDVGELVCIGREVPTRDSGTIDNLYLSTGGYVVVVETKLWRNPESRREVVAQVLDYVKDVTTRDFAWLDDVWDHSMVRQPSDPPKLFEKMLRASREPIDEAEYVDQVERGLMRGQVLALIVGDGIEARLHQLVEHLSRGSAHLAYSLGLVALRTYELDDAHIVIPELVQHVEPIERAFVRVELAEGLERVRVTSQVAVETPQSSSGQKKRTTLTAERLFDALNRTLGPENARIVRDFIEGVSAFGIEPEFKSRALMLKVADPAEDAPGASLLAIEDSGRIYNPDHGAGQVRRWGWDEAAVDRTIGEYWMHLSSIDSRFSLNGISHMRSGEFLPLRDLIAKLPAIGDAMREAVQTIQREAKNR